MLTLYHRYLYYELYTCRCEEFWKTRLTSENTVSRRHCHFTTSVSSSPRACNCTAKITGSSVDLYTYVILLYILIFRCVVCIYCSTCYYTRWSIRQSTAVIDSLAVCSNCCSSRRERCIIMSVLLIHVCELCDGSFSIFFDTS